jgi:protein tyrosine phosphatase (PTP) superfamily phosphohydrolase (DUF442 family)
MMRPAVRILTLAVLLLGLAAGPARADDLADARAFIGKQVELIKKGDVAGLKAGFTKRQQDSITEENVKAAQKELGKTTLDDLADARAFIGKQVEIIKKGDVAGLKAGFTKRQQDSITEENVKAAQKELGKTTLDDLVASVIPGKGSIKIKMKNGRTLTTLLQVDGKWLADSIWFK